MPKNETPPIIELTEIVQVEDVKRVVRTPEEELSGQVSDLMSGGDPVDDIELDDLLAQLNDGADDDEPSGKPVVNPNESLDLPGMDDLDDVMSQFDAPPPVTPKEDDDFGLDDLLGDTPAPAPKKAPPPKKPEPSVDDELDALLDAPSPSKKPVQTGSADELDGDLTDLLAELDDIDKTSPPPVKDDELDDLLDGDDPLEPVVKDDELDDLLSGLDDTHGKEASVGADDLESLFADTGKPAPAKAPLKREGPANPVVDAKLEGLLEDLDASVEAVGREKADSATAASSASVAGGATRSKPANVATKPSPGAPEEDPGLSELDALLDSEPPAGAAAPQSKKASSVASSQAAPSVVDEAERKAVREALEGLKAQIGSLTLSVQTSIEQQRTLREQVEALQSGEEQPAGVDPEALDAVNERLDALETRDGARLESVETGFVEIQSRLEAKFEELEGRLSPLTTALDELREQLAAQSTSTATEDQLGALRAEMTELREQLAAHSASTTTEEQFSALRSEIAELREQLAGQPKPETLEERFDSLRTDIVTVREQLEQRPTSEGMEERFTACGMDIDALREQMTGQPKPEALEERFDSLRAEIKALGEALAQRPEPAMPDTEQLAQHVMGRMKPEIEKAAAAAAANIIREEILAMFSKGRA